MKMRNYIFLLTVSQIYLSSLYAQETKMISGQLSTKIGRYFQENISSTSSQKHKALLEAKTDLTPNTSLVFSLKWTSNTLYDDLKQTTQNKNNRSSLELGENSIQYKTDNFILKAGYQELAWGEAFGFNYADIVNPKDNKETFYSDANDAKKSLLLLNFKYFLPDGSLQFIYSPEPKYHLPLPPILFTSQILPQTDVVTLKNNRPNIFSQNEYGGKLSYSFASFDLATFFFSHIDRNPVYSLSSQTATTLTLKEEHYKLNSYGASCAKTLFDNFVFRTDLVMNANKSFNTLNGLNLLIHKNDELNLVASLDSPTYMNFSGLLSFAQSRLLNETTHYIRKKQESYVLGKVSYDFGEDRIYDFTYTHELDQAGYSIQTQYSHPLNGNSEIKVGSEIYWGSIHSQLAKLKKISTAFISLKTFF
jgi:hypothetical protein